MRRFADLVAHARVGPLALAWEEPPFTWEAPHRVPADGERGTVVPRGIPAP